MQSIKLGRACATQFLKTDGAHAPAEWVTVILPTGDARAFTIRDINRDSGALVLELAALQPTVH
ncbi:hypothetical protein H6CHR_04030 [Variovorax sp. PBL-H6]|uniref:hypothetical protein n=1 Tax=Variovorax sp. PBL-H6 TaxID=434009 RepID=UPI0013162391|nr:hypothetical protein [Variovorax sp. PBL-H6]VTU33582.1 hypothetical protein H6CHR_04030 [Variovorax sp. PBL-H6]